MRTIRSSGVAVRRATPRSASTSHRASAGRCALALVWVAGAISGCRQVPLASHAREILPPPAAFTAAAAERGQPAGPGRQPEAKVEEAPPASYVFFADSQLEALVQRALRHNFNLRQAWARLEEARALVRGRRAERWPSLDANAAVRRSRTALRLPDGQEPIFTTTRYTASVAAAYEVDLWGRLAAGEEAATLEARAGAADVAALAMSTAAQTTESWLDLVQHQRERRLLAEQRELARRDLELVQRRFQRGQGSLLDVTQQEQQLESVRSAEVAAQTAAQLARHQLAVLVGQAPQEFALEAPDQLPDLPARPVLGRPAGLLQRRPDVAAALWRVRAADAQVAAALDRRMPTLRLDGRLFGQAARPSALFEELLWEIGAALGGPLWDAGRNRAAVDAAEARARQQLQAYAATFATALREVASALEAEAGGRERLKSLQRQLVSAQRARNLARSRFLNGSVDYLRVLEAGRAVNQVERQHLQARRELLGSRVQLHRALGGAPPPPPPATGTFALDA